MNYIAVDDEPFALKDLEEALAETAPDSVLQAFSIPSQALAELADRLTIPVIASGGAGKKEDFRDAFTLGKANAALAASVFHFGEIPIPELKDYLCKEGIAVRR